MLRMLTLLAAALGLALVGCIEKDFDVPPVEDDAVELDANGTIADLKEFFVPGEFVEITDDLTVDAVVVADDEAGNFYKRLVLQDETGGIEIQINETDLYTRFEEGRRVYIVAQGLYVGDFNGLVQIGAAPSVGTNGRLQLGRIESALVEQRVLRGAQVGVPEPRDVEIDAMGPPAR